MDSVASVLIANDEEQQPYAPSIKAEDESMDLQAPVTEFGHCLTPVSLTPNFGLIVVHGHTWSTSCGMFE
jgi:hypothetical protein